MLIALPGAPGSDQPDMTPSAAADRNQAAWEEWEAQARVTDGDYDGAVQAEQRANEEQQQAERLELAARAAKRQDTSNP
jgi:hypothetical protein